MHRFPLPSNLVQVRSNSDKPLLAKVNGDAPPGDTADGTPVFEDVDDTGCDGPPDGDDPRGR